MGAGGTIVLCLLASVLGPRSEQVRWDLVRCLGSLCGACARCAAKLFSAQAGCAVVRRPVPPGPSVVVPRGLTSRCSRRPPRGCQVSWRRSGAVRRSRLNSGVRPQTMSAS